MTVDRPSQDALEAIRTSMLDSNYVSLGNRRTTSVHEFYRYPARFSPGFAAAAIQAFSTEGEVVLDPFLGGGTTTVESMLHGRASIGSDLNELALFVSRAKTTVYSTDSTELVRDWARSVERDIRLNRSIEIDTQRVADGYVRNLDTRTTWRMRNAIALSLESIAKISDPNAEMLARCAVLRTAQVALDARREPLDVGTFRSALARNAVNMATTAENFADEMAGSYAHRNPILLKQRLPGLADHPLCPSAAPSLILTSPPYPGVYVLYHRWKIEGRRESPIPYWIANALDGQGQSHYTMSARADKSRDRYFEQLEAAYSDLARLSATGTWLVQVVGFNDLPTQLHRYLGVMDRSGFEEVLFDDLATDPDGRLWREVPSRRWWVAANARRAVAPHTSREVVLVHRRRSGSA